MKILKNVLLVFLVAILSNVFAYLFGLLYSKIFNIQGSWVDAYALGGVSLSYIFFLLLLFTAFGGAGKSKYWWIGILLIPALALEIYLDLAHIYFPILLALLGWVIGLGIQKLIQKIKH